MKTMLKLISLLTLIVLLGSVDNQVKASQAAGGIINYKYVGSNQYVFEVYFARWCTGVTANPTFPLATNVPGIPTIITYRMDTIITMDDCGNPLSLSSLGCMSGQKIELFLYRSIPIDFSNVPAPPDSGYYFRVSLCCRPPSNNLVGQPNFFIQSVMYPYYVQGVAQLPIQLEDNSPLPMSWPELLTYTSNDTVTRQIVTIDPDGDEVRYHLVAPAITRTSGAPFQGPNYNLNNQPSTGAIRVNGSFIDSTTGAYVTSRSTISTDFIAVKASSYRCGQLISSSIFEISRIIAATPAAAIGDNPPQLSGYGVDQSGILYLYPQDTLLAALAVVDSQAGFPNSIRAYLPATIGLGVWQPSSNCSSPPCLVITGNSTTNPTPQLPQVIYTGGDTLGYGFQSENDMGIQLLAYVDCGQYVTDRCLDTIRNFNVPLIIRDGRCAANNRIDLPLRLVQMELPQLNTPEIRLFSDNSGQLVWESPLDSNLFLPGLTTTAASLRIQAKAFRRYEIFRRPLNGPNTFSLAATITDINQRSWIDPMGNASYTLRVISGCDEFASPPSPIITSFATATESSDLPALNVYPNPTTAEVTVQNGEEAVELRLLDLQGRQLVDFGKLGQAARLSLDLSAYPGVVLLEIKSHTTISYRRIIVLR